MVNTVRAQDSLPPAHKPMLVRLGRTAFMIATLLTCSRAALSGTQPPQPIAEVDLEVHEGGIYFPADLAGRNVRISLGLNFTGALVLDKSMEPLLGKATGTKTLGYSDDGAIKTVNVYAPPKGKIGQLDLTGCGEVVCTEFQKISSAAGLSVGGMLGMSFLKKHVLQLDFGSGKLRLFPKESAVSEDMGNGIAMRLIGRGYYGISAGALNREAEWFVLGSYQAYLRSDSYDALKESGNLPECVQLGAMPGDRVEAVRRVSRIPSIRVGAEDYKDLIFFRAEGASVSGVGVQFLKSHSIVTFDFPRGRLYLKKKADADISIEQLDMSGLHLLLLDEKVTVHSVDKDSPAAEAGIAPKDVILQVGDKSAKDHGLWELRDALKAGDGKEVKVKFVREGTEREVVLKLKKKI